MNRYSLNFVNEEKKIKILRIKSVSLNFEKKSQNKMLLNTHSITVMFIA